MKYAMVGLMPFLMITSAWAGTLRDSFDYSNMNEWTIGGSPNNKWRIENGALVLESIDTPPISFTIGETTWNNYTVRVKAKIVKQQPCVDWIEAAALRMRHDLNGRYLFGVGTSGLSPKRVFACFIQADNPTAQHFVFNPFEWQLDTWYDLRVTAEEDKFQFYVDDALVLEYMDATYPTGGVGVAVCCIKTTVYFDDFSVTGDDVPNRDLVVSPKTKLATTWAKIKQVR